MHIRDQNPPLPQIAEDAALQDARRELQPAETVLTECARPFLIGAVSVCLLLSAALYNGYPTIFSDTGSYLLTGAFFVPFVPFRAPGYSIFTRITSLGTSAWFTIAIQAVIVVYVLYETCDYLTDSERKSRDLYLLASVCVLTALTSLPWLVSLLMPDVFAGVAFLSAFLLAFAGELHLVRRIFLAAIFMISVSAHSSLLPIAALFVAAVLILLAGGRGLEVVRPKTSALVWLLVPIVASGLWTANLNRKMGLGFELAPSRNMFLLAKLFGNGLAADYLRENCPKQALVSCRYLSDLPKTPEQFLFWHPLLRDLSGHEDEMGKIAHGTIRAYPLQFVARSLRDSLLQLASFRTGDEIRTYGAAEWNNSAIQQVFPGDFQAMSNDRQFRNRLLPLADGLAGIDTTIFWLSVAACLLFARTGRFARINLFFYSAMIFLVINASICATFAGVYDRYQSRVAWMIPFCVTLYICSLVREWKLVPAERDAEPPLDAFAS